MDQVLKIDTPLFLKAPLKTAGFPHQILLLILLLFKWIRFSRAEEQRKFKSVVYSRRDIKLINSQSFYLDSSYLRFVESFNIFLSVSGMLLFHGSIRDVQKHDWMKNNFTVLLVWNSFRVNDWVLKLNTPCFKDPAENCPHSSPQAFGYSKFKSSNWNHSYYLPCQPWIKMIVRREMLNLAALSKSLSKSLTSPDPLLVNMVNFVPTSYGLCGNFGLSVIKPQWTPGCL